MLISRLSTAIFIGDRRVVIAFELLSIHSRRNKNDLVRDVQQEKLWSGFLPSF